MPPRNPIKGRGIPRPLLRSLRPVQDGGVDFMLDRDVGALFMDMGLGKTTTALHACLELPTPILLVGPIRVIESVWMQEAEAWAATRGFKMVLLRGSKDKRAKLAEQDADIFLVNPEMLEAVLPLRDDWATLLVDESTKFKDPSSRRFKVLRSHLNQFERRYILTATPTANSLEEIWSQIFLLDQGESLGESFSKFRNKYFYAEDYMRYNFVPHDWAKDDISEQIAHMVYQARRDRGSEDEPIENVVTVRLPQEARKQYDHLEKHSFLDIDEHEIDADTAAARSGKLRQLTGGFVYDSEGEPVRIHSAKLEATQEIVDETEGPVIIVYQYRHELEALQKQFPKGKVFRPNILPDWDAKKIPELFLHPQSGGHGLNLQYGGSTMVFYSSTPSLEQDDQIRGRIDRSGQKEQVIFHRLIAEDTVDELTMDILQDRAYDQDHIRNLFQKYLERRAPKWET